jgi:hypothetical protein
MICTRRIRTRRASFDVARFKNSAIPPLIDTTGDLVPTEDRGNEDLAALRLCLIIPQFLGSLAPIAQHQNAPARGVPPPVRSLASRVNMAFVQHQRKPL